MDKDKGCSSPKNAIVVAQFTGLLSSEFGGVAKIVSQQK